MGWAPNNHYPKALMDSTTKQYNKTVALVLEGRPSKFSTNQTDTVFTYPNKNRE